VLQKQINNIESRQNVKVSMHPIRYEANNRVVNLKSSHRCQHIYGRTFKYYNFQRHETLVDNGSSFMASRKMTHQIARIFIEHYRPNLYLCTRFRTPKTFGLKGQSHWRHQKFTRISWGHI